MTVPRRDLLRWVGSGVALSPLGLAGCGTTSVLTVPESANPGTWNNAVNSLRDVRPGLLAYPSTTATVVDLVKMAEARRQRVRMTGSGHSFSDVALTDDMLLLPHRLSSPLDLDRMRLREPHAGNPYLVRVQAGITIQALNLWLDSQKPKPLALENLGGYDAQTIAGVAMTATHGTGLAYGPIASQILSLQIVTTGGEVQQIEPTAGITNPATFPRTLEEDASIPVTLIQDDKAFNAVSVSMGSMGIVTAVVLRTVDQFWLKEVRTLHKWSELAREGGYLDSLVRRPGGSGYPDHVEIYVNPYRNAALRDRLCVLTQRYRLATKPASTAETRSRGFLGRGELFNDAKLRAFSESTLRGWLNHASPDVLEWTLSEFLRVLVDKNYTAKGYDVFNLGAVNRLRAFGIEMAVPIGDTLRVMNAFFERAKQEQAAGRHHSVPVSLRFVKKSESYLAMQHGRDTMMLEMGALVEAHEGETLLRSHERFLMQAFGARPHWGLDMNVLRSWAEVEQLYGSAAHAWFAAYQVMNRAGTFDGRLTDRLGISMRPKA